MKKSVFVVCLAAMFLAAVSSCKKEESDNGLKSVKINPSSLTLNYGEERKLSYSIEPDGATVGSAVWSTADETALKVSQDGYVRALRNINSSTFVKVTLNGNVCDSIQVAVKLKAVQYVDLGLPSGLKWATCNLGAESPEDFGDYYAYGETEPYCAYGHSQDSPCKVWNDMTTGAGQTVITGYDWNTYSNTTSETYEEWPVKPYDVQNILKPEYDAATVTYGGTWRTPTQADWDELITRENIGGYKWDTVVTVSGAQIQGLRVWKNHDKNTNIFIPAAGYRKLDTLMKAGGERCYYRMANARSVGDTAYLFGVRYREGTTPGLNVRFAVPSCGGFPVRPVCK